MERRSIIKNIFSVHPLYYLVALIMALTGSFKIFVYFNLIIFVHELGHLAIAFLLGWKIDRVIIFPFGGLTIFNEDLNKSLKEEFIILISGPIVQIILTSILGGVFDKMFISISKFILMFNMLPIFPMDGSKLLNIVFNKSLSFKRSYYLTIYVSLLCILVIFVEGRYNFIIYLSLVFLIVKQIDEYREIGNIFNRFLLERYIKEFTFKKIKIIKSVSVSKMMREHKHLFFDGKRYITEDSVLKKRFDFNRKT